MVDDFQAAVVIGLVLISFVSTIWALSEVIKRTEMEMKLYKARKELDKYRLKEKYENLRQAYSKKFKQLAGEETENE